MNRAEYDVLIERAKELRDAIDSPISSDPFVLSVYVRETVTLIINILEAERNER